MRPPAPPLPVAETLPATRAVAPSDSIVTEPPALPFAEVVEPASSRTSPAARRTISPASFRTSEPARMVPEWVRVPANTPTAPPSAISLPRLSTVSAGAWTSNCTPSRSRLAIETLRPAASRMLPPGVWISPLFSTSGAISATRPP